MQNKITEIITEPNKIYEGSTFKLKIKVIRYLTYEELEKMKYEEVENYTYSQIEGV